MVEAEEELTPSSGDNLYLLTMEFAGWLNGSLVGFYRTTYTENGQVKSIAATDHEPTDARKSFPCFDEPNKKATYTISITHPKEYEALSNMPVAKEESVDDKWTRTTFEKSVPMSTYLVCFAVHQFHSVKRISNSGKPIKSLFQILALVLWRTGDSSHTEKRTCFTTLRNQPHQTNRGWPLWLPMNLYISGLEIL